MQFIDHREAKNIPNRQTKNQQLSATRGYALLALVYLVVTLFSLETNVKMFPLRPCTCALAAEKLEHFRAHAYGPSWCHRQCFQFPSNNMQWLTIFDFENI